MVKRSYSQKTIKVLFALSGNRCAYPDCIQPVISKSTEHSDDLVVAQISHIYAISIDGPRGKKGLSEKELNSPSNLLLLCPTHHVIIDGQHETYPAQTLLDWKNTHESRVAAGFDRSLSALDSDVISHPYFPRELVDHKIEEDLKRLRRIRFDPKFDQVVAAKEFATKLFDGDLAGGSTQIRSIGLAWCARFLSQSDITLAEKLVEKAETLHPNSEATLAKAFIASKRGATDDALSILDGLDSQAANTAGLLISAARDGVNGAIDWLSRSAKSSGDLDSEGRLILAQYFLQARNWSSAYDLAHRLSETDFRESPILHLVAGIILVVNVTPDELKELVTSHIPLGARDFPLADSTSAMEQRRSAFNHFEAAEVSLRTLGCEHSANLASDYALWLKLKDPDTFADAQDELEISMSSSSALRRTFLAFDFGIKLNHTAVSQEIEGVTGAQGQLPSDAALAKLALTLDQPTQGEVASSLSKCRDQLAAQIDPVLLLSLEAEAHIKAGNVSKAKELIDELSRQSTGENQVNRLRHMLGANSATSPTDGLVSEYDRTKSLADLAVLVDHLFSEQKWSAAVEYSRNLFESTQTLRDAEIFATSLYRKGRYNEVCSFCDQNSSLCLASPVLQELRCWALYFVGDVLSAKEQISNSQAVIPSISHLKRNIGIALGDWTYLLDLVTSEYKRKDELATSSLLELAKLALLLGSPIGKDVLFEACNREDAGPGVLSTGYFLASRLGWEKEDEVLHWLKTAIALSDEGEGPLQRISYSDLVEQMPAWDERESAVWDQLSKGEIPLFLAGRLLNRTVLDLTLLPALANQSESDPRKVSLIPAFSGNRTGIDVNPLGEPSELTVCLDSTAIVTLSVIGLFDEVFQLFDKLTIPHSTMGWLVEDFQRVTFHQPSRAEDARTFERLLTSGKLEVLTPSHTPKTDLIDTIGYRLAQLLVEAENPVEDSHQCIVVRPPPVHRIGSLMVENVELEEHADRLANCSGLITYLRKTGHLTAREFEHCQNYLKLQETDWPNQSEITDNAILYLDDLATTYFLHLDVLDKLHSAGFRVVVTPEFADECSRLLRFDQISNHVAEHVEQIRSCLHSAILNGKVLVAPSAQERLEELDHESEIHPTLELFDAAKECNLVICDDRNINQHPVLNSHEVQVPILSSLDVLDLLREKGAISVATWLDVRTLLRRSGYCFIPVTEEEIEIYVSHGVEQGVKSILHIAEAKAIKEIILRIRMSDWLQLPAETQWLFQTSRSIVSGIRDLWESPMLHPEDASTELIELVDMRGWSHRVAKENRERIEAQGRGVYLSLLLTRSEKHSEEREQAYWKWLDESILGPIREEDEQVYATLVSNLKAEIDALVAQEIPE
ncbi:MAG: hypothetical protein RJQ07_13090 [Pseudomonadales bacterium]